MSSFHELTTSQLRQALRLREQIETLQDKLNDLLGGSVAESAATYKIRRKVGRTSGKRTMSSAARARIASAQQARWAKLKGANPPAKPAAKPAPKKKRNISAEGRAKLAAAMKARWAVKKDAAAAPGASAK